MIKIIQISDFHYVDTISHKMMRQKVCDKIRNINPDILLITGDLHNYGNDFEPFKQYVNELMVEGNLNNSDVFIVPGNHDVDKNLSSEDELNRNAYIGRILSETEKNLDCYKLYRDRLSSCFKGFNNTVKEVLNGALNTNTVSHYIWEKSSILLH